MNGAGDMGGMHGFGSVQVEANEPVFHADWEKKAFALDFRETAPAASRRELYMKDGQPVSAASLTGPLAVAVPGEVAGLIAARKRFGSLPLPVLAAPAIESARLGPLSTRSVPAPTGVRRQGHPTGAARSPPAGGPSLTLGLPPERSCRCD